MTRKTTINTTTETIVETFPTCLKCDEKQVLVDTLQARLSEWRNRRDAKTNMLEARRPDLVKIINYIYAEQPELVERARAHIKRYQDACKGGQ